MEQYTQICCQERVLVAFYFVDIRICLYTCVTLCTSIGSIPSSSK